MMRRFNHAFTFGFSLDSDDATGEHVPARELRTAIIAHLAALSDAELIENCGLPYDSYANDEPAQPQAVGRSAGRDGRCHMTMLQVAELACPRCGVRGSFLIDVATEELAAGPDTTAGCDPRWNASSSCTCLHCHHQATAGDFIAKAHGTSIARYDHAFTIAFSLVTGEPDARDAAPALLRAAILERLASLCDVALVETVGAPYDTSGLDASSGEAA